MSKEERDKKRQKKRKLRAFFISFVLIYLLFRSVPVLYASNIKTTLVEKGSIEESIDLKAVIIRNERLYKSDGEGKINILKDEGERVKVGAKIAEVTLDSDQSALKTKLNEVNEKIDSIEKINKENKINDDTKKAIQNTEELLEKIQQKVAEGDYDEVNSLKEQLYASMGKQAVVSGDDTLANQSLEQLNIEKERLIKEIKNNTINYFSQEAGIVSFKIDGLEEVFNGKNINEYSIDDMKKAEEKIRKIEKGDKVGVGDTIFKIMDNYNWYIMAATDEAKKLDGLEKGNFVTFVINNNDKPIRGRLVKVQSNKGQAFIVVKFDKFFHDYYDLRNVDVKIIKSSNEGLKIPLKAISEKEGISGVYIKDTSGIIKFRPIKILGQNDDFAIVSKGDSNSYIDAKGSDKKVRTVKLFDEILLSGGKVKEGQIVD
ncbi:HlyD family efflux transporter periplasmic adaptor subunit [Anaerosalibacter sp. Marseille-P3206]|uniref:HlyD family efflux transporter periplasmic adaptor subunit n=1 Tax=Anaerosalibacter sp. Marseille-P3206 TaxID=1871005 RepID=UPI0009864F05|nr:HlyD family efflux transporter periplasmic adaptor subunit [Anaerosalibacter sp. Marseille-P3206]